MTQPEVSMTPEEVLALLGSFSGDADYNFNFQLKCEAARAAVAELVTGDLQKECRCSLALRNEREALRRRVEELERVIDSLPTNWCDPLLSGPNKALPDGYSYTPIDVEKLLIAIRDRAIASAKGDAK